MKRLTIILFVIIGAGAAVTLMSCDKAGNGEEESVSATSTVSNVRAALPGRWRSTQDENSVVIFNADGTTHDVYGGNEMGGGTWQVYEGQAPSGNASVIYLRKIIDGEAYEYAILVANEEQLTISYLPRGNTLDYRRLVE